MSNKSTTNKSITIAMMLNLVSLLFTMLVYVIICDVDFNVAMSQRFQTEVILAHSALIINIISIVLSQIILYNYFKKAKGDNHGYQKTKETNQVKII